MEAVTGNPDINNSSIKQLEESVARILCEVAEVDPDSKFYPVHPSHSEIFWPMWQAFRPAAKKIIAMVQATGIPTNA